MALPDLTSYAAEVLGPHQVAQVHRATPTTVVHEVVDAEGVHWFVKAVVRPRKWQQELGAYRSWVPGLGDRAPRLGHADDARQAFVTSAVPGWRADALETCRRLQVAVPDGVVHRCLDGIAELDPLPLAPCHGDYLPTNWLIDDDGVLRLIDFGEATTRPRGVAFARLHVGAWWERPDLAEAFQEGYGDSLTDVERRLVELHRGPSTLMLLRWGAVHRHADVVARAQQRLGSLEEGRGRRGRRVPARRPARFAGPLV